MLRQAAAALTRRAAGGFHLGSLPQLIPPRPPAPLMQRASASTFVRTSESGRLTRKVTHYRSPRHTKTRVQRVMEHPTQSLIGMTMAGLVAGALSALAMEDSRADAEAVALVKSPLAKSPLSSSSSSSSSAITRSDSVKEPATGIVFPLRLDADPHISSPSQQLIATGCTYRMLGLFAVYAVGMYMDVSSARRNLKIDYMQGANTVDSLLSDPKFFNSIINDFRVSSRLTLKMNRQVDANDMAKSLRDSVKPHVMQRNEASVPALEKMCTALRKRLGTEGAKQGLELSFVFFQGGRTYVLVDGVQVPEAEVTDWAVSSSILESFIGAGAEAPDLRVAVAKGFLEQVLQ